MPLSDTVMVRGADYDIDPRFVVLRKCEIADNVKLLELGDRVAAVGDQLSVENIVVAVQPLLDDRKHILAVNGQRSFFCHVFYLLYCLYDLKMINYLMGFYACLTESLVFRQSNVNKKLALIEYEC